MSSVADVSATYAEFLRSCRFCLRLQPNLRPLSRDGLPITDIPHLFESVTQIKLDLCGGYSELWCQECEHRMRAAAQTRSDFVRVVQQWEHLLQIHKPTAAIEEIAENALLTSAPMKQEMLLPDNDALDSLASDVKREYESDGNLGDGDCHNDDNDDGALSDRDSDDAPLSKRPARTTRKPAKAPIKPRRPYQTSYWRPPKGLPYICDICGMRLSTK